MPIKTTQKSFLIPTIVLKDSLLHFPGVTFNLSLSFEDAFTLLDIFLKSPDILSPKIKSSLELLSSKSESFRFPVKDNAKLSKNSKDSINEINSLFAPLEESKRPVFACIPFNSTSNISGNIAIISCLTSVQILPDRCVFGLKGECKAFLVGNSKFKFDGNSVDSRYNYIGEVWYEMIFNEDITPTNQILERSSAIIEGIKDNLSLCEKFVNDYANLNNETFKDILTKLNPLAELLSIQLNDSVTNNNLAKLSALINSIKLNEISTLLKACDIYVAIFPFSFEQGFKYLQAKEPEDILDIMLELTKFVKTLFTEYLDVNYVLNSWNRLGKLQNGKILQSRFVVNHFTSLKQLLDKTAKTSRFHSSHNRSRSSSSFSNVRNNNEPSDKVDNDDDDPDNDNDLSNIESFILNIHTYEISEDGINLLVKDYKRLKKMQNNSSEYQQLRNYFEIVMDLPWSKKSSVNDPEKTTALDDARKILDEDHYGMQAVKVRILEHLAILKLTQNSNENSKCPILLLNGPPGVGKTSLAKSIARSLNCEFQRVSLGGISDFADIKGHRRTYVGAIPGLLIQALRRAKSMNAVILLDEIDKIGNVSNKGNPEAALLEILDPEQNINFTDHYIGFPVDLSKIVFIATSNDKWDISEPLRDRMETIDLDGYNCKEKVKIAQQFILPRQIKRNGLEKGQISIDDDVLQRIATSYTHEAGIRNLERLIGKICRKKAVELLLNKKNKFKSDVNKDDLIKYLGVPKSFSDSDKFSSGNSTIQQEYGLVNGLSYNSDGSGSLLKFEMIGVPGSQNISCTGMLGNVLLESCEIAETLVEHLVHTHLFTNYEESELIKRMEGTNVHMHVPEGAIRKDGPSAGITMTLCYLSLILQLPVPSNIAMTGEITLTGKALAIGGLKEKLLGASLSGQIDKVIAPRLNRKDMISAYIETIENRDEANMELTALVLEEERCLSNRNRRYKFSSSVEDWVSAEYGIDIKYVDDFTDVIREVWDGEVTLLRKEVKAHL